MANAAPLNFGPSTDGPLTGSKRKSTDTQDGTEVDEPRSAKIARKESQEKKRDVDIVDARARVAAQTALQEPPQERPSNKAVEPEPVVQPRPLTERPPLNIFDDEIIPHHEDEEEEEDTHERLRRLTEIVKAALPGSCGPSGGVVQMEANEKLRPQRSSKEEKRKDSGRLSLSHLVGAFEKKDRGQSYTSTTPPHSPPLVTTAPAFEFVPSQLATATTVVPFKKPIFRPLPPKNPPTRTSSQPVFTGPQAQYQTVVPHAPSQLGPSKLAFNKDLSRLPPTSIFDAPPLQGGLGGIAPIGPAWQLIPQPFSQGTQSTEFESIFDVASREASQPTTVQMSQSNSYEDDLLEEEVVTFPGWGAIKPDEEREGETMAWVKDIPGSETEEYIHEPDEEVGASDEENARAFSQESEVPNSEVRPIKGVNTTTAATTSGGIFASMASMATKATNQLKSLRLAAAAAEKDKAEKEKKEKRKLEMEARRQAAAQKKADEERGRREEAERKRKAEEERRKKEREEVMANRSTKLGKSTAQQEEASKKPLKLAVDTEKKIPQLKKQPSKVGLGTSMAATNSVKLVASTGFRPQPAASSAATSKLVSQSSTLQAVKKTVAPTPKPQHEKQPSQIVQARMQARYQAQFHEEDLTVGGIDESADLPDIRSEYSDSEDEDRPQSFNPPEWAQSPNLLTTLENMRTVNPDTIFGAVPKLEMEEIFPGRRGGKFRVRTSSANWAGTDGVTVEEEIEYAKRMGFTK